MTTPSPELVDQHLNAVLQASGSALRYFTMPKTLECMRGAMREAMTAAAPSPTAGMNMAQRILHVGGRNPPGSTYVEFGSIQAVEALVKQVLRDLHEAAPAGFVPAPIEATVDMKSAAVKYVNGSAVYKVVAAEALRIEEGIYGEVYEAMIKAAPIPVAVQPDDADRGEGGTS